MMTDQVNDFLGADILDRINGSQGPARGLPRAAYTDPAFLKLEYDQWLSRTWLFVGHAHEIPQPGDAMPISGLPLMFVHGHDGKIRAFYNVCRHRGHVLLTAPCQRRPVL